MPRTNQNKKTIAIIGGGASAALLLAHMAAEELPCAVDVYDRAGRFARGVAYSTSRLCHLLNVRASNMSGLAADKDHFARWAGERGYQPSDFVPRKVYGDYLESLWGQAQENIEVHTIQDDVEECRSGPDGYALNGRVYDEIILASGNVQPLAPAVTGPWEGYYPDPWSLDERVKGASNIALIGSGLTAADAVLSLLDIGFKGRITIFSRHALWPMVHIPPGVSWELKGIKAGLSPSSLLRAVRGNIREAAAQNVPWQFVINALRPITNEVWQSWSASQKAAFQRHLYTLWGVHRHRMAPEVAARIGAADIVLVQSRVKFVNPGGLTDASGKAHEFDAVVNCMGYRYEQAGRTFEVSYRLGPARFGALFETTAIPEIRAQAAEIANALAGKNRSA